MINNNLRIYKRNESIVFRKTHAEFGGLSNMASGYTIVMNNINILTSEALYQCCRYPHVSEVQKLILSQKSPMTAKMISKKYYKYTRSDWNDIRVNVMRWALRVKLLNNYNKFGDLLIKTGNKAIVEESLKDDFWGAKPQSDGSLVGNNVLGRLLMELRYQYLNVKSSNMILRPLNIEKFYLLDNKIPNIQFCIEKQVEINETLKNKIIIQQGSLFRE